MQHTAIPSVDAPALVQSLGDNSFGGGYRAWTASDLSFADALETKRRAHRGSFVVGDWSVSYDSLDRVFSSRSVVEADDGKITLRVHRFTSPGVSEHHPLYGTKYDSMDEAQRAAYNAHVLSLMVYADDEVELGLVRNCPYGEEHCSLADRLCGDCIQDFRDES